MSSVGQSPELTRGQPASRPNVLDSLMLKKPLDPVQQASQFRPHPWHGLEIGPEPPGLLWAFIEITPFDLIKYEVDKHSGYLRVDRPQRGSSQPPALYGFIPRTYCAERVHRLSPKSRKGDGDPLDICVLSERPIARSEILVRAKVVGGLQMVDGDEADDKVIAVLETTTSMAPPRTSRICPRC